MSEAKPIVYLVDDDASFLHALVLFAHAGGA